ncbi:MAG: hypothetical protein ACJ780_30235 [Solirubrobacteraceae bacterium]
MHTTSLRSDTFEITVGDHSGTISEVFPGFDARDRLGIVIDTDHAAAGAGTLILAAVTAFYDCLRAAGEPFFAYADYFAFHVGVARGSLRKLDVYPGHKEVVVPADPEQILQAINDRAVTRLLVPDGEPIEPALAPETRHGARRRIRTALAYSPTGRTARPDILVRGSAQSDSYIDAMLGSPGAMPAQARPAQGFRRVGVDEALGLLVSARG